MVDSSEEAVPSIEMFAAFVLVALFAVGVFDLLMIGDPVRSGRITDPNAVVGLIDTAVLLFIIVEIYQTAVAYTREKSVVRVVIIAGGIPISRKVITFRPDQASSEMGALLEAVALAASLFVLVGSLSLTVPESNTVEEALSAAATAPSHLRVRARRRSAGR